MIKKNTEKSLISRGCVIRIKDASSGILLLEDDSVEHDAARLPGD